MPCKLSFSCWLQGGRHAQGCGENRWLFSCCVPDTPEPIVVAPPKPPVVRPLKPAASKIYPKVALLRRRIDTEAHNYECGISRSSQNTLQKRIIGGRLAQFAEYPWQAHIRILEYQCGGVLRKYSYYLYQGTRGTELEILRVHRDIPCELLW